MQDKRGVRGFESTSDDGSSRGDPLPHVRAETGIINPPGSPRHGGSLFKTGVQLSQVHTSPALNLREVRTSPYTSSIYGHRADSKAIPPDIGVGRAHGKALPSLEPYRHEAAVGARGILTGWRTIEQAIAALHEEYDGSSDPKFYGRVSEAIRHFFHAGEVARQAKVSFEHSLPILAVVRACKAAAEARKRGDLDWYSRLPRRADLVAVRLLHADGHVVGSVGAALAYCRQSHLVETLWSESTPFMSRANLDPSRRVGDSDERALGRLEEGLIVRIEAVEEWLGDVSEEAKATISTASNEDMSYSYLRDILNSVEDKQSAMECKVRKFEARVTGIKAELCKHEWHLMKHDITAQQLAQLR